MKRKPRQRHRGCALSQDGRKIRLRWRLLTETGRVRYSRSTGLDWNRENKLKLRGIVEMVAAMVKAGRGAAEIDRALEQAGITRPEPATEAQSGEGENVADYYARWYAHRRLTARPEQAKKYRLHFLRKILPIVGDVAMADLNAEQVRGFQAYLLGRHGVKYSKNIMASFRAMLRRASLDGHLDANVYGGLEWPDYETPDPDPLTADERTRILAWFKESLHGFRPVKGSFDWRMLPHPPFHAYVLLLFWTGMRPSEASGLKVRDVDLERRLLFVRRSRHGGHSGKPKHRSAKRTVELFPSVAATIAALIPPGTDPDRWVFLNTQGRSIEPHKLNELQWTTCLRELGIAHRGLYATKDTFVTSSMMLNRPPAWLEQQTGVAWGTLRTHYARWLHSEGSQVMDAFAAVDPTLFETQIGPAIGTGQPNQLGGEGGGGGNRTHRRKFHAGDLTFPAPPRKPAQRANWTGPVQGRKANGTED